MDMLIAKGKNSFATVVYDFCPDWVSPIVLLFFLHVFLSVFSNNIQIHLKRRTCSLLSHDGGTYIGNFSGRLEASKAHKVQMVEFQVVNTVPPRLGNISVESSRHWGLNTADEHLAGTGLL